MSIQCPLYRTGSSVRSPPTTKFKTKGIEVSDTRGTVRCYFGGKDLNDEGFVTTVPLQTEPLKCPLITKDIRRAPVLM